jgi:hypothetical protein
MNTQDAIDKVKAAGLTPSRAQLRGEDTLRLTFTLRFMQPAQTKWHVKREIKSRVRRALGRGYRVTNVHQEILVTFSPNPGETYNSEADFVVSIQEA